MITTAKYLLIAYVESEQYYFEYEHCGDMWEALETFWHEDYPETLQDDVHTSHIRVDVLWLENGKLIRRFETAFDCAHYHSFFDHGHTVDGPYLLDTFRRNLQKIRKELDIRDCVFKNAATSLFFYMWNCWCEEECKKAFADGDYNHFWNKWCSLGEHYTRFGAVEHFYSELTNDNRDKLVKRACEMYDGSREKY